MEPINELLAKLRARSVSIDERRDIAAQLGAESGDAVDQALLSLMQDEDELVRYNAINSSGFEHRLVAGKDILLAVAKTDPDADCRDAAASALGNIFQNSRDKQVLSVLREIALNDSDTGVRRSAYKSAVIISGVSPEEHIALLRDRSGEVNRILLDAATGQLN